MCLTVPEGGGNCVPWLVQRTFRLFAVWVRSARFCLPQSTAFCSSWSPGRETCERLASAWREAILAASSPAGWASSLDSSLCDCERPWSEPAAPTHRVLEPLAGTVTWYCSSPPLPLPYGPSLHWLGIGSVSVPGQ